MEIAKNVAPRGFPICRSRVMLDVSGSGFRPSRSVMVVFRRNSWVMATPIEAKEREVRSQARKVRSVRSVRSSVLGDLVGN